MAVAASSRPIGYHAARRSAEPLTMPETRWTARLAAPALTVLALASVTAGAAERWWPPVVDPATNQHTPGRWVWADLVTSDVGRAAEFYGQVFGWTFETYGGEDDRDTYTLVLADGLPIGGMVYDGRALKDGQPSARWIGLVSVPDVGAAAAAAERGGGRITVAPVMLGERGETAVLQDRDGAVFGVVRSRHGDPADYTGGPKEWVWLDLWTADVSRAADFYRSVVGYELRPLPADGERRGVHLVSGGHARAGVMQREDAKTTAVWLPYVRVTDARAATERARAAGGRVLREPQAVGAATVAIVADPTGAPVGIAQLPEQEARP
jgi:predicted enzyme related to lactoylglutathione lyase